MLIFFFFFGWGREDDFYCQVWIYSFPFIVGHSQHTAKVSAVSWMPCLGTVHPRNILAKKNLGKIFSLLQKACEGCREMAADSISELPTTAATRGEESGMLPKKQTFAIGFILLGLMIEGRGKLE